MFQFKQFTIHQDRTAMKVGTDGVLLGAWAPIAPDATRLLDIGTGTGLIALMLAQRIIEKNCPPELGGRTDERSKSRGKLAYTMPCKEEVGEARQSPEGVCNFQHPNPQIVAIDIDHNSIEQATENIQNSPFAQHITTHHTSLQDYMPDQKFDAIVCNPPYFVSSLKSPDAARTQARHTDTLSFDDLLHHSARLLRPDGSLSVVLPVNEGNQLIELAPKYGFMLTHLTEVHPTPTAPPKRLLLQFVMQNSQLNHSSLLISHSSLTIEIARHQYTDEYIALTRNFYLKM